MRDIILWSKDGPATYHMLFIYLLGAITLLAFYALYRGKFFRHPVLIPFLLSVVRWFSSWLTAVSHGLDVGYEVYRQLRISHMPKRSAVVAEHDVPTSIAKARGV